jgi:hypothetical protein
VLEMVVNNDLDSISSEDRRYIVTHYTQVVTEILNFINTYSVIIRRGYGKNSKVHKHAKSYYLNFPGTSF